MEEAFLMNDLWKGPSLDKREMRLRGGQGEKPGKEEGVCENYCHVLSPFL